MVFAPAIVQDYAERRRSLMLGFMNQEALEKHIKKGGYFLQPLKKRLWTKGEESNHF